MGRPSLRGQRSTYRRTLTPPSVESPLTQLNLRTYAQKRSTPLSNGCLYTILWSLSISRCGTRTGTSSVSRPRELTTTPSLPAFLPSPVRRAGPAIHVRAWYLRETGLYHRHTTGPWDSTNSWREMFYPDIPTALLQMAAKPPHGHSRSTTTPTRALQKTVIIAWRCSGRSICSPSAGGGT